MLNNENIELNKANTKIYTNGTKNAIGCFRVFGDIFHSAITS
jgi:hypothetical protein